MNRDRARPTALAGAADIIIQATEDLYLRLFTIAAGFVLSTPILGMALAPLNRYDHHAGRSVAIGAVLSALGIAVWSHRPRLFYLMRRQPLLLLGLAAVCVAALWGDGGWRSSFYLATYGVILLSAVVATVRWTVVIGLLLAAGYAVGLVVNGYTWASLTRLNDADSVVANTAGYVLAAYFLATPVDRLVRFVATVNQRLAALTAKVPVSGARAASTPAASTPLHEPAATAAASSAESPPIPETERSGATDLLSTREYEVALLVAEGYTNAQIADCLHISEATVKSHVGRILKKLGVQNRGGVMSLVLHDRLLPTSERSTTD